MGIKLPEYDEVSKKIKQLGEDELNPLEKFIYNNEPAGAIDEKEFRSEIQAVLDWISENIKENKK